MKPVQLLVTVALVGCGLLLYDTLRGDAAPPAPVEVPALDRPPPPAPGPGEGRIERPVLQGMGIDVLANRLGELEERLGAVEDALTRRRPARAAGGSDGEVGSGLRQPPEFEPGAEVPSDFTEEQVAWFRALSEEVLRIRREESEIRSISAQLDRIRPDLPGDLRDELIEVTRKYRAEKREILGEALREKWSVDRRQEALQAAHDAYQERVYRLAPGDGAAIVGRFGNFPGQRLDGPFVRDR